jgi:quinol monooxygenase YgiN
MNQFALLALLRAKPGKEQAVEEFLVSARPLVLAEVGTTSWYAVRFDDRRYGIFDTFVDEDGRNAHLNGQVAALLLARRKNYLQDLPQLRCWRF